MESPQEDNKRVCMHNIKNKREIDVGNVYEKSESILNSQTESFQSKTESLIELWKQLSQVGASPKIECIIHLMDWAKLHTLNIVLSGDWKKYKETYEAKLLYEVENCEKELYKLNNTFSLHCQKLMKVITDPWGNSTLHQLLNTQDHAIGRDEFEFFMSESGYLVSMRLKKLCESHCEDLALNLITAHMRCREWAASQNINMNLTEDQKRFMLDVYIALLYKYKKTAVIVTTLKTLSLKDGLELVKRFAKKRVSISKLWKYSNHITQLATVLFCSTAVLQPIEKTSEIFRGLVDVWLNLCERDENLDKLIIAIRKVVKVTVSAPHMFIFCQALNRKFGQRIKTFNIELYVQALTTDLNILERQKNEDNRDHLQETSKRLAEGLLQLAEVLEDHINVCRECVLTSFSLQPTKESLRRIEDLARKCGYEVLDTGQWKCKLHPPISSEDDLGLQCYDCGDFMGQLQLEAALNTNTALSEALTADRLGVSPELCDDLAVLVCSPRYQLLSWLQKWPDLHRLCVMYLNDPERTKNLVTELKFLEIDYSMFMNIKREPEDEFNNYGNYAYGEGMELGMYSDPNLGEPPKPKRKRGRKKKVREEIDTDYLPVVAPKSDPEVLKTLRSFRRTFKRKNDSDTRSPGKVFIGGNIHFKYKNFLNNYENENLSGCKIDNGSNSNYPTSFNNYNNYNTPYVNNYGSFSSYTNKTFSEIAFRAHEEMLQNQGLYPQNTYYDGQTKYVEQKDPYNHSIQGPSTSTESVLAEYFAKRDRQRSPHNIPKCSSVKDKSFKSNKRIRGSTEHASKRCNSENQLQIEEQHFLLNDLTNEMTIQGSSDSLSDEETISTHSVDEFSSTSMDSDSENSILAQEKSRIGNLRSISKNSISGTENSTKTLKSSAQQKAQKSDTVTPCEFSCVNNVPDDLMMVRDYSMKTLQKLDSPDKQKMPSDNTSQIGFIPREDITALVKMKHVDKSEVKNYTKKSRTYKAKSSVDAVTKRLALKLKHTSETTSGNDNSKKIEMKDVSVGTEKNLFREKLIETVFAEENRKTLKELVKESLNKKSEGSCNKENSRFVAKKKPGKSEKPSDTKTSDKVSPKHKKSDACILEKSKESIDKLSSRTSRTYDLNILDDIDGVNKKVTSKLSKKLDATAKSNSTLNFQEVFQESLKTFDYKFNKSTDNIDKDNIVENDAEYSMMTNDNDSESNHNPSSIIKVNCNSSSQEQSNNIDYTTKFNLKDLRVILHRLNVKFPIKKTEVSKNKSANDIKKSAKKVQSPTCSKHKVRKSNKKVEKANINRTIPVYDKTLKVIINNNDIIKPNLLADYLKSETEKLKEETSKLNPRVVLERLELDRVRHVNSVLANVPGLNDTELIRPGVVDSVVHVVQIAGGRQNSTVSANTQTSTQVTPHIQRIGQPRTDKPETPAESSSTLKLTATSNTKPATSQPSTLISMLSPQMKPGQSNNCTRNRTAPLINILSQQIIKPANVTVSAAKSTSTTTTSEAQSNSAPKIVAGEQQIINQIMGPVRTSVPSLKLGAPSESSRIVQFICQSSDGKLIPVTSFTPNRVVKVATTQTVTSCSPGSPNYDENYTKLIQTPKSKNEVAENSETLPKFQQAFGKSVYQNKVDSTNSTNITNNVVSNTEVDQVKTQPKCSTSLNIKPIHGGVIYTRQMPVGQTINLIPQTHAQVFRIATTNSEQISLVKETVIHNKMSALLAAALQGKKNSEEPETNIENKSGQMTRVALTRPTLVQNTRIVKPVLQIPSNVIRNSPQTNLSSTTLEQLREFDMVYKQVKERSSTVPANEVTISTENSETPQRISVTYLNQGHKINCAPVVVVSSYSSIQPAASPALSVASQSSSSPCVTPASTPTHVLPKVTPKTSKGKSVKSTTMHTTAKAAPIPKPQQKPQEDEHTTQRIFDILAEYAEQLRNSPDLNNKPAPRRRSNPPTNPSQNSKRKKSSSSKKTGQCSSSLSTEADVDDPRTMGSEDSSCGVMQLSIQEDEQPSAMASTSESNDSSVAPRQQLILTDSSHNQTHNLIITDSSVGEALKMPNTAVLVPGNYIMPVSVVKGGQQIAVVSGGSKILATVPARSGPNMLLFQSFLNQTRKTAVPTVKYSTIQPITGISSQSLAGVSAQPPVILPSSHGISTVTLGQSIAVKKLDDSDQVNTELLLTISQSRENDSTSEDTPQPDSSTNIVSANIETVEIEETATLSDTSSKKAFNYRKPIIATPIATPVIAQATCATKEEITIDQAQGTQTIMTLSLNTVDRGKGDSGKTEERVQSVLVTAGTSSGPMLSHSPPQYKQSDCSGTTTSQSKDDFVCNTAKKNQSDSKNYQGNMYAVQGKIKKAGSQRLDRELQQICLQRKQAALERELRLQKSLSEECEDLGVDEPSTSDLFPEADLLFDSNHSPSFDQPTQDIVLKRPIHLHEGKEEAKLTLFNDDDFLFESGEYRNAEAALQYEQAQSKLLTNGQSGNSTESESPCEDNTLLQTCTSMSDVTLNSPISPETYNRNTSPPVNKYVHKYSNKKKNERVVQVENWTTEISSSEDTTGSTELVKSSSRSPELCLNKRSDEELSDRSFKVVHVAISKTECGELHCTGDTDCSLSGRGARRSVKKLCSCCNGSQEGAASRKRPASQPQTPTPHKKAFSNKKR